MKRAEFFGKAFKLLVGSGLTLMEDNPIVQGLEKLADDTKRERPPGAAGEGEFQDKCTGCDACMIACPVNVVMIEDMERRLPVIYPEKDPCIHCEGYPCIQACPTDALQMPPLGSLEP